MIANHHTLGLTPKDQDDIHRLEARELQKDRELERASRVIAKLTIDVAQLKDALAASLVALKEACEGEGKEALAALLVGYPPHTNQALVYVPEGTPAKKGHWAFVRR
jgi:hypothetical protein